MITGWHVRNFKSYRGSHDITLASINVIAGSNSSGKSTLIQSILALKQTIEFAANDKYLLLNGPLTRLGSFKDVLSFGTDENELSIGFECKFSQSEMEDLLRNSERPSLFRFNRSKDDSFINNISFNLRWAPSSPSDDITVDQANLSPDLLESKFTLSESTADSISSMILKKRPVDDNDDYPYIPFVANMDPASVDELSAKRPKAKIVGGYTDHFIPRFCAIEYNASERRAQEITQSLFANGFSLSSSSKHDDYVLPMEVVDAVLPWLEKYIGKIQASYSNSSMTVGRFRKLARPLIDRLEYFPMIQSMTSGDTSEKEKKAEIANLTIVVKEILSRSFAPEPDVEADLPSQVREGATIVKALFKSGIKYLGPLRNPPRPVYQLEIVPSNTDVGFRGEHTAAILDLNRTRRVSYIVPPSENLKDDYFSSAMRKTASLHDAVVDWLSYLGVASDVNTTDEGIYGNRLKVKTRVGGQAHDLTNVGVGVSQVLPIVVMALLAPKSALLIFEQPELHLHPKVQARLADFFIALAVDGKQTLSETHSEYIVDRLRLRVALSDNDDLRNAIRIMFSSKDDYSTSLKNIEITEYGAVVDWPVDFFDQSQNDISKIIKAAADKRRRKSK